MSFIKTLKIEFKDAFAFKKIADMEGVEIIDEINSETSHNNSFIQDFKMKMRDILLSNLSAEEKLQELNELRQS